MPVELHEQTNQREVLRRYVTPELRVAIVAETEILRGLHPIIEAVKSDQRVELVRLVQLFKQFSEAAGG